jgi:hypothetical protein
MIALYLFSPTNIAQVGADASGSFAQKRMAGAFIRTNDAITWLHFLVGSADERDGRCHLMVRLRQWELSTVTIDC